MVKAHVGCALAVRKRPNRALVRGRVEGLAQGRAEGHAKGLREGLKRGELKNQKLYLLCLVKERFKTVPQAALEFAVKTTDMQALRDLTGEARRAASLTDFLTFLAARQAKSATLLSASSAPACRDDRLQDGRWDSRPAAELQRPDRVRISGLRMKDKALRAEGHAQGRADGLIAGQSQGMAEGMAEQRRQAAQHGLIQCLRKMALNKFGVSLPDEWLAVAAADMERLHDLARGAARAATLSDFQDLLQAKRMWPIEPTWASGPAGVSGRRRRRTDRAGRPARRAPGLAVHRRIPGNWEALLASGKIEKGLRTYWAGQAVREMRLRAEGRAAGLAEGMIEGVNQGRALAFDPTFIEDYAQGYVEGFLGDHAKGRAEEQHTIATRLLALGRLTLEEIAACAGLTLDEVRALAAKQQP